MRFKITHGKIIDWSLENQHTTEHEKACIPFEICDINDKQIISDTNMKNVPGSENIKRDVYMTDFVNMFIQWKKIGHTMHV